MSKGTTTVTVIALVQLVAILLLYNKIVAVERGFATVMSAPQIEVQQYDPAKVESSIQLDHTNILLIEDRMRQIIREELDAQLSDLPRADQYMDASIAPSTMDETKLEYQRELVATQLDYYTSIGSISNAEMQKLQMDIAKLDDASRTEMLRELIRALNTGRLEGQL